MILDANDRINLKKINDLKEKMKEKLGEIKFKTWIEYPLSHYKIEENILYLEFQNEFSKIIFEERYLNLIKENIDIEVRFLR
ncbi:DnaA N-terminal domain-containing protein (plasmid) [Clostridium baratii]|uniref:DnaA N-terminal domain-containing protein n=1 Tax=Clostridium baratii TaxID=1561 RepID=UPI0030D0D408